MTSQTPEEKEIEEIAKCIGRAVASYANKIGKFYHNDKKYAYKVPYTCIETEAENIYKKLHQQLQKAREEERRRCIKVVEDYGKSISKLHSKMIGTAHEDSKMMLAFDMHSRLIAVKHLTEKMNQSELDQPTQKSHQEASVDYALKVSGAIKQH